MPPGKTGATFGKVCELLVVVVTPPVVVVI
jgi:hypothetical protein